MHPSYVPVYSTPTPFVYHAPLAAPGPERPTALKLFDRSLLPPSAGLRLASSSMVPRDGCCSCCVVCRSSSRPSGCGRRCRRCWAASRDSDDGRGVSSPGAAEPPSLSGSRVAVRYHRAAAAAAAAAVAAAGAAASTAAADA